MSKIRKEKNGIRIALQPGELNILRNLPLRLKGVLEKPDLSSKIARRLFPPSAESASLDTELRLLLAEEIRQKKLERLRDFEQTVNAIGNDTSELRLSEKSIDAWLGFLNDIRVVLGTSLDLQDESWIESVKRSGPWFEEMTLLVYLSILQSSILRHAYGLDAMSNNDSRNKENYLQ